MNCKENDLAFIIRADSTPTLLGHVVRILRPWPGPVSGPGGFPWEVAYPEEGRLIPVAAIDPATGKTVHVLMPTRVFGDNFLLPLRPGVAPLALPTEETIHESA